MAHCMNRRLCYNLLNIIFFYPNKKCFGYPFLEIWYIFFIYILTLLIYDSLTSREEMHKKALLGIVLCVRNMKKIKFEQ